MKIMKWIIVTFCLGIILFSCRYSSEDVQVEKPDETQLTGSSIEKKETLEPASKDFIIDLQKKSNGIEATMYSSSASFSVFDKNSVLAFSSMISYEAPASSTKNQIGHIMFLQNGKKILLVNVYDNGTHIYIGSKDEKTGKEYFNILMGQARDLFTNVQVKSKE